MRANFRIGRIFGIEIGIHYSWLLIAILIVFSLSDHFRSTNAAWGHNTIWVLSVITSLLFFVTLLTHEMAHALFARFRGIKVKSIVLFALGGVTDIERDATDAKTEFWMGLVGPLTSAVLGMISLGIASATGWSHSAAPSNPFLAAIVWLGYINLTLAVFNMIPCFPLDGGRVMRGLIWGITGDGDRAMRIAVKTGQFIAGCFIILGILSFFGGSGFGGLWIAFIGWFLMNSAKESFASAQLQEFMRGVKVGDIMTRDCPKVAGNKNLRDFVDEDLLHSGNRCFLVMENEQVAGLITPHEIKTVSKSLWPLKTIDQVMRPINQILSISSDTPLIQAIEAMTKEDFNQLPVLINGKLSGILSRSDVLRFLQSHIELNA